MSHAQFFLVSLFDYTEVAHFLQIVGIEAFDLFHHVVIDLVNQHQMTRQQLFKQFNVPFFQGFREDGVVRIAETAAGDIPGGFKIQVFLINENTHHFRDGQSGMGVVQLDGNFLGKLGKTVVVFYPTAHDILEGGADEKVFLFQA